MRRSLLGEEARRIFDTKVPGASVAELFERLRGRPLYPQLVSKFEYLPIAQSRKREMTVNRKHRAGDQA